MGLSNKRKKRTKAEQKERRQRNGGSQPGAPLNLFMAVTEADFADRWTAATWESIKALCGNNVDGEEICHLAEIMLTQNIDPQDRPVIEALAAAWASAHCPTLPAAADRGRDPRCRPIPSLSPTAAPMRRGEKKNRLRCSSDDRRRALRNRPKTDPKLSPPGAGATAFQPVGLTSEFNGSDAHDGAFGAKNPAKAPQVSGDWHVR